MVTLFRYAKCGRTRTYSLRQVSDHSSELWVVPAGRPPRKLLVLQRDDDLAPVLKALRSELRAGGWSELPGDEWPLEAFNL